MLKVKPFLFILFLTVFVALFTTACSDTGSSSGNGGGIYDNSTINPDNPGGGNADKPGVTAIDLAGNPFSLLGVYNVTLYGIDGEPVTTPASKSELRVGLNLESAEGGITAPEVLMYLDFEGKKITFDKYIIDLSGLATTGGDVNKFIADTFAKLGAELIENSKYSLYFTLDPANNPQYSPILDKLIIKNGQYLKLKLDKTQDLVQDGETPTDPDEPVTVPVESVAISEKPANVVHGGASFKLTASVLPNNATNKVVTWSSSHPDYISVDNQGNVIINSYTEEPITITATSNADNSKKDEWTFNIEKAKLKDIIVNPQNIRLTLRKDGSPVTTKINTAIEPAIATSYTTIKYQLANDGIVSVDNNGTVKAEGQGNTMITVTAQVGDVIITKEVEVEVSPAPDQEIPATGIKITTDKTKVYKKGSNVAIDFELTPKNTTDTLVSYKKLISGQEQETNNITTNNGIGQLLLSNIQETVTIVFSVSNSTGSIEDSIAIEVIDGVNSISFEKDTITKEQGVKFTNNIKNKDTISSFISSWTYSSDDNEIASVDPVTGEVTPNKNGITTIRVKAQPKYDGKPIEASFQVDVLGHIDWADENSIEGTYDIVFFGTNSNGSGLTAAVLRTNCDIYKNLWEVTSCPNQGALNGNYEIPYPSDFAGRAVIKTGNGVLKVHTKVAMLFSKMGGTAANAAKNDRYQYTVYGEKSLNGWMDKNIIGTMIGRHLSDKSNAQNPKYYFEQDKKSYTGYTNLDIVLFSHFEGKSTPLGNVSPDTRLILRKISSQVKPMDANSLAEEPFNKINLALGSVDYIAPSLD